VRDLPRMAKLAGGVLHAALDAFVHEDAEAAEEVFRMDDDVDELYGEVLMQSLDFMRAHSERVPAGMRVASCAKYLERIADHATNIAEMVVFLVRG
jgi:phosphate transport system protein